MAIQYSGSVTNTTFTTTTGTRREIVDGLAGALVTAGWSYVSGSGTGDVVLQIADSGLGLSRTRLRILDPGSGSCAQLKLHNSTSTLTQTGSVFLLPGAGKVYKVNANPYQFFCTVAGSSNAREYAAGGQPWVPSFLAGSGITACGWLMGNAQTDTDTTVRPSFRTQFTTVASGAIYPNMAAYTNANFWEGNNTNFGVNWAPGVIQMAAVNPFQWNNNNATTLQMSRWQDSSVFVSEPLIGWCLTTTPGSSEAFVHGQLWDAVIMSGPFAVDQTATFDSHNWINLMTSNTGSNANLGRGSLFIATS